MVAEKLDVELDDELPVYVETTDTPSQDKEKEEKHKHKKKPKGDKKKSGE